MKYLIFILIVIFSITGCQQNEEPVVYQETGVVVNFAGADHCSVVIELDNGEKILPLYYPEGFVFYQGQRLLINYMELPNIMSTCAKGKASEILYVEELSCGSPITETGLIHYNNIPNDPVFMHEAYIDGDCLHLKVSFSGGCRNHEFSLVYITDDQPDDQNPLLTLMHYANGDMCEAALSMELRFDISTLWEQGYKRFTLKSAPENGEAFIKQFENETQDK